jgi:hypothetical protein
MIMPLLMNMGRKAYLKDEDLLVSFMHLYLEGAAGWFSFHSIHYC